MPKIAARNFEKAIFLDRDGVINYDVGNYTTSLKEFEVLDGVIATLKNWFESGYGIIVVTNQGGIDKGLFTEDTVIAMHNYLQGLCNLHGFAIDAFYYCMHHPEASGKCLCRKPGSLLVEKALHHFGLNPANCIMYGDRERDIEAAAGAGVKGVLIEQNRGLTGLQPF
jgi:D-glycero-D-manno-heptose 1,7-bisphosphate phosphatase